MPILIDKIPQRDCQSEAEWAELLNELNGNPELWEVYVDGHWIPLTEEITKPIKQPND